MRVAELGQEAIRNTRPRPVSPFYSVTSLRMTVQFVRSLRSEVPPDEVLSTLQNELDDLFEQGRQQGVV